MGQDITTFNIDELVSSYIDNQITDAELKKQIEDKLNSDEKLRAKYKSELLTKNLLQHMLPNAELPEHTYRNVMSGIDKMISDALHKRNAITAAPPYPSFIQSLMSTIRTPFLGMPRYVHAMAAIILIIGAIFIFNEKKTLNPYITSGTDKSIMVQAVNSFHKILDGEVKPQLNSGNAAEVEEYVKQKSNFVAYVPKVENYELKGVVCNEYNGQKLAHIIYQKGENIFYIYQTPVTCLVKKNLDLPDAVHNEIVTAQFFMCDAVDENDCTMTVWIKNNVLCASMCNIPKQEMHATFTSFYK